jgi:hypothetical protein
MRLSDRDHGPGRRPGVRRSVTSAARVRSPEGTRTDAHTGAVLPRASEIGSMLSTLLSTPSVAIETRSLIEGQKKLLDAVIRLLADAIDAKPRHETGLGHETGRVETALALAAQGKHVALVY